MKTLILVAAVLLLGMCLSPGGTLAQAPPGPIPPPSNPTADQVSAPTQSSEVSGRIVIEYTLPPDLYRKAKNLSRIRLAGALIVPLYGFVVLWLVLQWKLAPRYRNWAEDLPRRFVQVLIFAPLFTLTVDILELPIGIFENWISRKYNLSVQGWGSWAWDWTKSEFLSVIWRDPHSISSTP